MAQPVVHFEIIGKDPERLRSFYGDLFGWEFDTSGKVSEAVSEPTNYGFVTPPDDATAVAGGVGGGAGYDAHVVFYVAFPTLASRSRRPRVSVGRAGWGPTRRRGETSSSGISPTPKAT